MTLRLIPAPLLVATVVGLIHCTPRDAAGPGEPAHPSQAVIPEPQPAPAAGSTPPAANDTSSAGTQPAGTQPAGTQTAGTQPAGTQPVTTQPGSPNPRPQGGKGAACGGIAGLQCQAGLYCAFAPEAHCGAADQTGICQPIPEMCTEQFAPVCGCDDKTYPNACAAARAGVSVGKTGACATAAADGGIPEGKLCGTRGAAGECAAGLYCNYRRACGADDSGGTCTKKTSVCTRIYAPVCGCDGKTHASACVAASAGVSVATQGECKR